MSFEAIWDGDPLGRFRTREESEAAVQLGQLIMKDWIEHYEATQTNLT